VNAAGAAASGRGADLIRKDGKTIMLRACAMLALLLGGLAIFGPAQGPAAAQAPFDLGPEQPGRVRAEQQPVAIAAIPKGFKFAAPGVLTVAVSPGGPPLATYATDAKTVVGADADFALLVADSLGLRLDLQPIAWADWPLNQRGVLIDIAPLASRCQRRRSVGAAQISWRRPLHRQLEHFRAKWTPVRVKKMR